MDIFAEWTFEGVFEGLVGNTGNRTRYQFGIYVSI